MTQRVGIIGCGTIFKSYLANARHFRNLEFTACADLSLETAMAKARLFDLEPLRIDELLGRADVDIILNLTSPAAHREVTLAGLLAGKHVYSEKPLATTVADGRDILAAANAANRRVGAAPDTVLGPGVQTARRLIDTGAIGKVLSGRCVALSHGAEHWHPNPTFLYKPGGGPVLDFGPYLISALVTLLGPVAFVVALGQIGNSTRTISAPLSTRFGQSIDVEVPTTVQGLLQFEDGAQVSLATSWDAWGEDTTALRLYGRDGSVDVPDPNWFGGDVVLSVGTRSPEIVGTHERPAGRPNHALRSGQQAANYRGLGLAEMAQSIEEHRPHRLSGEFALHVLAVTEALLDSSVEPRVIPISQTCDRPGAMSDDEATTLLGSLLGSV